MVIERAFGLLKCRWRSLLHVLAMNSLEFIPYHILACCVLHNICLEKMDELQFENDVIIIPEAQEAEVLAIIDDNRIVAEMKRNNICANLPIRQA